MNGKDVACAGCGAIRKRSTQEVNRAIRNGRRLFCSIACAAATRAAEMNAKPLSVCAVADCPDLVRSRGATYCEMHFGQMRRNGYLGPKVAPPPPVLRDHSHGYKLLYAPGHRLANKTQCRVYEHRAVYYQHHGEGPFPCYWCGTVRTWEDMHVDHLDDDKENNHIDNLAASCPECNQKRGVAKLRKHWREHRGTKIEWRGEWRTAPEWSEITGLPSHVIKRRIAAGWDRERVMTTPNRAWAEAPRSGHMKTP